MSNSVEALLTQFFPSNLQPWFDEGATGWDSICLGFDKALDDAVSGWDCEVFDHFPIWVHRELGAVVFHDRDSGLLSLSIHPSQIHLEGHLVYLLWCGRRDL
jgi:hypothetical protein